MAERIHETERSRIGSTIGASLALPRTFYVEVALPGNDPVLLLQRGFGPRGGQFVRPGQPFKPAGAGLESHPGIPLGSSHPWNRTALAKTYSIQDNIGVLGFMIRVDYKLPQSIVIRDDFSGVWNMAFRAASIPRRLLQEFGDNPRIIGANKYKERNPDAEPPDPPRTHTATVGGQAVPLFQLEARELTGADAPIPAASMVLRKTQRDWNVANVGNIVQYKGATNSTVFFGAQPGHIEFVEWSIDNKVVPTSGATQFAVEHSFALSFFFSSIRLDQLPILHTFETEDGGFVKVFPVSDSTTPVEETFVTREQKNLDTLLGLFV